MTLAEAAARLLSVEVAEAVPLHGGDLSQVLRLRLADGRSVVAKSGPFPTREAGMLRAMRQAGAAAPEVIAADAHVLVMADLGPAKPATEASWLDLAGSLQRLHEYRGATFGWHSDFAFGDVAIRNSPCGDWPAFWAGRRLLDGLPSLPADLARRLEALCRRLSDLLPGQPDASLLHGDLWTGNVHFGREGRAWLIDPASYHGHAEVDLAMLSLIGRPPNAFVEAYGTLDAGWQERRAVYQLWPALVHLRLFGPGYRPMVEGLLGAVGA